MSDPDQEEMRRKRLARLSALGVEKEKQEVVGATSPTATSPSKRSVSCEDNLPPRKRKVSQEHHLTQLNQDTIISINGQRSPHKYNGIHANDGDSGGSTSPTPQAKSSGSSADSEGSTTPAGSPDKSSERILKEDPPSSTQTCE